MRVVDIYEYFKKNPRYNKLVGNDFLFVEYKCPLEVENFQLWTKSHLITYVVNGKKDWLSTDKAYHLTPGDALFVRKGMYTTRQYFEEEYCVMLFFMSDRFIREFIVENGLLNKYAVPGSKQKDLFEIGVNDSFKALIESLFHYFKKGSDLPVNLIEIKFKELLFNIALNPENRALMLFLQTIDPNTKPDIEQVMSEHFLYDLNMEAFARLCGRSLSAFKRDFKHDLQITPSRWLMTRRLEYATTLLIGTGLNVSEVCYESGFKNPSHFIRSFKHRYNATPNQYREAHSKS